MPEFKPKIIIECKVYNALQSDLVLVSTTSNYYKPQNSPYVDNAIVIMSDNLGRIDTLQNLNMGGYRVHGNKFYGPKSNTYTLKV